MKNKIIRFVDFLNEGLYDNVKVEGGDQDQAIEEDHRRLNIIAKYLPFNSVTGYTKWEEGLVHLIFDDGRMTIDGKYISGEDIMPSTLTIGDEQFEFNWHPWGQMGSTDFDQFEKEIKEIKESIGKWTVSVTHEGYAIFNIGEFSSEEEALKKVKEYNISLIKGKQMDGKLIKDNKIKTNLF
jgi:hypothetical protein